MAALSHRALLGRDAELCELGSELRSPRTTGRFVCIRGEGGIGKTSLIDEALRRAAPPRPVLRAAADAMDRRRTFGLLLEALAPALAQDERRLIAERNEHTAGERLLTLVDRMAADPAVIVLEDLQWADAASLRLLARLTRTLEQLPLLIIGSMRTQARHRTGYELGRMLDTLGERDLLHSIELAPLPSATCIEIAEGLTGARVAAPLARYIATAGGNPLFVTEMIRALQRDGALTIDARGEAALDAPVGPSPSLAMVMMRHLSHLTASTRDLLTTAAMLGTRFTVGQLRVVADRPMTGLVPLLSESFAAGFLEETDDETLGFRHELIQEVLLHDLPAAVRAELHREIAIRLDAAGVSPATVAGHLLRAATSAQDPGWMLRLAQRTAVSAPATAIELWERVVAATPPGDPMRVRATAGLARAALSAGHAAESAALAEDALRRDVPPDVLPGLTTTYTHALMLQHRHAAARDEGERFAVSDALAPADRAAHLAFAGWPRLMLGDIAEAKRLAQQGATMAAAVGDHGSEAMALTLHGQIADFQGDLDEAVALLTEAAGVADRHPSLAAIEAFPHAQLALALSDVGRLPEVAAMLQRGLALSEEFGYRTGFVAVHAFGAQAHAHTGILPDIVAELDAHRALVESMDVRLSPPVLGLRAEAVAHQKGPAAALEWAARLDPVPGLAAWAGRGRARIWLGLSQIPRARAGAAETFDVLWQGWEECRSADMQMDCAELALDLAELAEKAAVERPAERTGLLGRAREVADLLTALADRNPAVTHLRATALGVTALVTGDAARLVEAARLMGTTLRRLETARLDELAALALGRRDGASTPLAESALHGFAEVGADHDVVRARAAFRRSGIPVLTAPHIHPTSGWEALTRTELRIADHVATGATNPEIAEQLSVSRRTVETHVSNVLTKLGLRSRTELAVFVARRLEDVGQHRQ